MEAGGQFVVGAGGIFQLGAAIAATASPTAVPTPAVLTTALCPPGSDGGRQSSEVTRTVTTEFCRKMQSSVATESETNAPAEAPDATQAVGV